MSDDQTTISQDFIEQLKAADPKWRDVEIASKIEAELRDSPVIKVFLSVINDRAMAAVEKYIDCDVTDTPKLISLQAEIRCARIMGETIEAVRKRGAIAADALQEADRQGYEMSEEGRANDNRG